MTEYETYDLDRLKHRAAAARLCAAMLLPVLVGLAVCSAVFFSAGYTLLMCYCLAAAVLSTIASVSSWAAFSYHTNIIRNEEIRRSQEDIQQILDRYEQELIT